MNRIGILGGTFDPVHGAHLELAELALEQHDLDFVLFVPAGQPVRKLGMTQATAEQRLHMLRLACADNPDFKVSSFEIDRPQVSYTIDTLKALKEEYGDNTQLFLILGEDNAVDIATWRDSDEIAKLVTVLYAKRPGAFKAPDPPRGFTFYSIEMPQRDLSSSQVKQLLQAGEEADAQVPESVLQYIKEQGLYGQSR